MGFTEYVKRRAKRAHAHIPWYVWVIMPSIICAVGVVGMVIGEVASVKMALLLWVIMTFAGPILYEYAIMPALRKLKKA